GPQARKRRPRKAYGRTLEDLHVNAPRLELGEELEHARAVVLRVAPDPADELELEALDAAFGQVDAPAASVAHTPAEDAPEAAQSRDVEEDDRVGPTEARIVEAQPEEVAVHDP